MSIVVFWLDAAGAAAHTQFAQTELLAALRRSEELRQQGMRHVTISTELDDRVGTSGVAAVERGRLPSGEAYDFSKAHRGAGPSPHDRKR